MRLTLPIVLLAGLTAGCADPTPFIDQGTRATIDKPRPLQTSGFFQVCYSNLTPLPEVQRLADEECGSHGLQALLTQDTRWQCRATSPHARVYRCIDPEMRLTSGEYVNPFDEAGVRNWERTTGKRARFRPGGSGPQVVLPPSPEASATTAPPPPAPVPRTVLAPADVAGKPAMPAPPVKAEPAPPPPPPLPLDNGFTMPQGSWGDHLQD